MAEFVRFYRITPADYWALTQHEDSALEALMQAELRARARARSK